MLILSNFKKNSQKSQFFLQIWNNQNSILLFRLLEDRFPGYLYEIAKNLDKICKNKQIEEILEKKN